VGGSGVYSGEFYSCSVFGTSENVWILARTNVFGVALRNYLLTICDNERNLIDGEEIEVNINF